MERCPDLQFWRQSLSSRPTRQCVQRNNYLSSLNISFGHLAIGARCSQKCPWFLEQWTPFLVCFPSRFSESSESRSFQICFQTHFLYFLVLLVFWDHELSSQCQLSNQSALFMLLVCNECLFLLGCGDFILNEYLICLHFIEKALCFPVIVMQMCQRGGTVQCCCFVKCKGRNAHISSYNQIHKRTLFLQAMFSYSWDQSGPGNRNLSYTRTRFSHNQDSNSDMQGALVKQKGPCKGIFFLSYKRVVLYLSSLYVYCIL